jgi:Ca-activated chloride channel family protein
MNISFTHPFYLLFLFSIPILIFFHFFGLKNLKGKSLKFANFEAIARVKGIDLYSKNILLLIFNSLFIILLVFALSGLTITREIEASSFSFVIAIDNSESMSAIDLSPNRLEAAKEIAIDFVNSLAPESYVSILSFSGESRVEQMSTKNKQEIKYAIENIGISEIKGTDIFEATSNSIKLLDREKNKAIILLSDGQINIGGVNEAIDYAKFNEVLIHTIGIGSVEGGETNFGFSKLDEDSLKSLAYNTGGKYFNVKNKKELSDSFSQLSGVTRKLGSTNLGSYLIIIIIILFIVKQFLMSINKLMW